MHQRKDVSSYGGFAARQADFRDALGDEEGGEEVDFRGGEELCGRRLRDSFFGHAIQTSQVAFFGQGYPEVVVLPVEGVCEEGGEGFGFLDGFPATLNWCRRKVMSRVFLNCGSSSSGCYSSWCC
jgi:hypothetical protein